MLQIIPNKKIFLTISALLVLASIVPIILWGLKLGIDFSGGSIWEVEFINERPANQAILSTLTDFQLNNALIQKTRKSVLVTVIAENIEIKIPIASVKAKPRTTLLPNQYKITQVIKLEILESRIDVQARLKPSFRAKLNILPLRNSSFILSNIRILASTAMPTDRTNPAMPAVESVTGMSLKSERTTEA